MMVKYKVNPCNPMIEKVEVVRETESFVYVLKENGMRLMEERRELKEGVYFGTFKEAKDHLISDKWKSLVTVERCAKRCSEELSEALALKETE